LGLTANGDGKSWFRNVNWLRLLIVLLAAILLVLLYFKVIAPRVRPKAYTEQELPAIKVVVKNGCGVEGLAAQYSEFLEKKNIDVVSTGDTPHPIYNKSVIEVKANDTEDLARLRKMTGIERYTLAVDTSYAAPFIIILGSDYEELMKK